MQEIRVITTYYEDGEEFKICKVDDKYCGVNVKYIENDRITKPLTNAELNTSDTIEKCIEGIQKDLKVKRLVAEGYTEFVAMFLVSGYSLKQALELERRYMEMM